MRHKLVHDYYDIDAKIAWRVATALVPQLLADIAPIIEYLETQ
jgi:uncharacterized protein with HEPN domain